MLPRSLAGFTVFVSFLAGVFAASYFSPDPWAIFFFASLGLSLLITGILRRPRLILAGSVLIALGLGLWRMGEAVQPNGALGHISGSERTFNVLVLESPTPRGEAVEIIARTSELTGSPLRVQIITRPFPKYRRGETLAVSGIPRSAEAERFPENLKRRGIDAVVRYPAIDLADTQPFSILFYLGLIRDAFEDSIRRALPEPDAGYVLGILLGERASISEGLRGAFARTGTSHIVALSGFNITIIAVFIGWMLSRLHLSPRVKLMTAAVIILIFVLLVEGGASVVRASVMGILALIARERSRIYEMTNALIFAGAVMVFMNPYLLRFDLSFQLSFLATLGIIIVPPFVRPYLSWITNRLELREILAATISAELFVFPLIIWHFGTVSLIGPVANLLILPAIPPTMFGGFVIGVLGLVLAPAAQALGWIVHILISYELGIIKALAGFSGSAIELSYAWVWVYSIPALGLTAVYIYRRFSYGIARKS